MKNVNVNLEADVKYTLPLTQMMLSMELPFV